METLKAYAVRAKEEFGFKTMRQVKFFRKYSEMKMNEWPLELVWYVQGRRCGCGDDIYNAVADFCKRKDAKNYLYE